MSYQRTSDGPSATAVLLTVLGALVGLFLIATLSYLGAEGSFWWQQQQIEQQSKDIRLNYATQESDLNQLSNYISQLDGVVSSEAQVSGQQLADLKAQALGIGNQACELTPEILIPLGPDASWVHQNCAGPAVSPSSSLRS